MNTVWSFPLVAITTALLSASVTDAFCTGWTSQVVTDLSSYTLLTAISPVQSILAKLNLSGGTLSGPVRFAPSTADGASFIIPTGSATPTGAALVDGAVWGDGANIITRLAGTTRVVRDSRPGSIPNTNLADMPANTIKGRLGTVGAQTDLTFGALLAAFGTFINGSPSGYVKIPLTDGSGVLVSFYLQWGTATGSGDVSVSFPMEFPNAVLGNTAPVADSGDTVPNATTAYCDFIRLISRTGMVVCKRSITGAGPNTHNLPSRWIAVGY